jgi:hypothetical protein
VLLARKELKVLKASLDFPVKKAYPARKVNLVLEALKALAAVEDPKAAMEKTVPRE